MPISIPERIIALDLRPKSLGFVVLEGEERILDWGAKAFCGGVNAVNIAPGAKVKALLAEYLPDALVLRHQRTGTDAMLREVKEVCKTQDLAIRLLPPRVVKKAFVGCRNKDQIAATVSERFPPLLSILPPKRKFYDKEDWRIRIFDAAAAGLAYFMRKRQGVPVSFPPS
jgi:hypothetical protein